MKALLCWLLRGHAWRRMHKIGDSLYSEEGKHKQVRVCARCGATRLARKRKSPTKGTQ